MIFIPNEKAGHLFRVFAGNARFVKNRIIAFQKERDENGGAYIQLDDIPTMITAWKKPNMLFLADTQPLQQAARHVVGRTLP